MNLRAYTGAFPRKNRSEKIELFLYGFLKTDVLYY